MTKIAAVLVVLVGCHCQEVCPDRPMAAPAPNPVFEVHFSPNGECEASTIQHIDSAKRSVFVQAYSFTSGPITEALIRAKNRGVEVEVLLDKSNIRGNGSTLGDLRDSQVSTWVDSKHAIAHNKVMIFDQKTVETGSFNFTKAAEHSNAENCLFIQDQGLVAKYMTNWQAHRAHSE